MNLVTHWIDGAGAPSTGTRTQPVLDPATGEQVAHVVLGTAADVDAAVAAAAKAAVGWARTPLAKRASVLAAWATDEWQLPSHFALSGGDLVVGVRGPGLLSRFALGADWLLTHRTDQPLRTATPRH